MSPRPPYSDRCRPPGVGCRLGLWYPCVAGHSNMSHVDFLPSFRFPKRRSMAAKVGDGHGELDFLSSLPDDLLSHVLSFLDTEDAIRTKLLSRRWRHLYPANSSLEFLTDDPDDDGGDLDICTGEFVASVDEAMRQFRPPKLASLILFLTDRIGREYACNVDGWIRLASAMRVEKIQLDFGDVGDSYLFPFHLLGVRELSHLKHLGLGSCSLPSFTSLDGPIISLRKLELSLVSFYQNSGNFDDIASYCPNLKSLLIERCQQLPSMRYLCGRLNYLKSLYIWKCSGSREFEIHDSNLTKFSYFGSVKNISLKGLNCLLSINIRIQGRKKSSRLSGKNLAILLSTLPEGAPQLESLSLTYYPVLVEDFPFPTSISTFKCLKYLLLSISTSPSTDLQILSKFLHVAPLLQKLTICLHGESTGWSLISLEDQLLQMHKRHFHSQPEQHVPEVHRVHSLLKEVEINRFCCLARNDVEFAFTMLKIATSLEKIVYACIVQGALGKVERVNHEILQKALAQYKIDVKLVTW